MSTKAIIGKTNSHQLANYLCVIRIPIRPKIKMLLFPERPVTAKIFTQAAANLSFLTNLIKFFV